MQNDMYHHQASEVVDQVKFYTNVSFFFLNHSKAQKGIACHFRE